MRPWEESPLDEEELRRVAEVRRDVWRGAFRGTISGACLGATAVVVGRNLKQFTYLQHNKYLVGAVLVGATAGAYLGAVTAGKTSVQYISDVFRKNAHPPSHYQQTMDEVERQKRAEMEGAFTRRMQAIEAAKIKKASDPFASQNGSSQEKS